MQTILSSNGRLPIHRTINRIAVLVKFFTSKGIPAGTILDGSGITPHDLEDPYKSISPEQELMIFRRILDLNYDPEIGLILGNQYHLGVYGKVGITVMHCDTFMDAFRIFMKYAELSLTFFHHDLSVHGELAFMAMRELIDLKDVRCIISERELVSIYRGVEEILGVKFSLKELHISYPEPDHGSRYTEYFNCPVIFNAGKHMFVFDRKALDTPLPKADSLMKKLYEDECNRLYRRVREYETLTDRIYNEALFSSDPCISMERIARQFNMSTRTLRRQLADEGRSFQEIISEISRKKAVDMLLKTNLTIERIAEKTGYSDTQSFHHAFKKWTGITPAMYRRLNRKEHPGIV